MARIRLAVIEHRTLFRQALVAMLQTDPDIEVIGDAGSAEDACRLCDRTQPHVVLLDELMAGSLLQEEQLLISRISASAPRAALLVVGRAGDTADIALADSERHRTLQEGANAYVCATIEHSELVRAIRNAAAELAPKTPAIRQPLKRHGLTGREESIAALIAGGLCNKEIAHRLGISTQTVKNHVSHVLEKLALSDRTQIAVYALGHGLA